MNLRHIKKAEKLCKRSLVAKYLRTIYKIGLFFPFYLLKNTHPNLKEKKYSHFVFNEILFDTNDEKGQRQNDLANFRLSTSIVYLSFTMLVVATISFPLEMLCLYWLPWIIYNYFLFVVTFLHHTDPSIPWYYDEDWDFLKGALSTQDHTFGGFSKVINFFHHNIESHHVVHHIFISIPHYHLEEATERIKPLLGDLYRQRPFSLTEFPKAMKTCRYVLDRDEAPSPFYYRSDDNREPEPQTGLVSEQVRSSN